jgi:hypothetical protein
MKSSDIVSWTCGAIIIVSLTYGLWPRSESMPEVTPRETRVIVPPGLTSSHQHARLANEATATEASALLTQIVNRQRAKESRPGYIRILTNGRHQADAELIGPLQILLRGLWQKDPLAVIAWYQAQEQDALRFQGLGWSDVLRGQLSSRPHESLPWFMQAPPALQRLVVAEIIKNGTSPEDFLAWLKRDSGLEPAVTKRFRQLAWEEVVVLVSPPLASAVSTGSSGRQSSSVQRAFVWASQQPDDILADLDFSVESTFNRWLSVDPASALTFYRSLPEGQLADRLSRLPVSISEEQFLAGQLPNSVAQAAAAMDTVD